MITSAFYQWGNEVVLKYAHEEPTALDLRRMAEMLRREALNCDIAAAKREDAEHERQRAKDAYLP